MSDADVAAAGENEWPALVLGLSVCVVWAACAWFSGGFGTGAVATSGITLIVLLVLGVAFGRAALVLPTRWRAIALASLTAFVIWAAMSIVWAHVRADAWVGTEKALVYALGFAILVLFPVSSRSLDRLLAGYVGVLAFVGLAVAAKALHSPASSFTEGRLQSPTGYVNATVSLWMLAFWPACHLMTRRASGVLARIGAAAAATLFVGLAVLGQSRAWVVVSVAVAVLFLILSPSRRRLLPAYGIVAGAIAIVVRPLTAVFGDSRNGVVSGSSVHAAFAALGVAILVAAGLTAAWTDLDRRGLPSRRVQRAALALLAALAVLAVLVVGVRYREHVRHPYRWAASEWRSFTQPVLTGGSSQSRFFAPLGSDRYQEWRIAWAAFRAHPLTGIGSENFKDAYLLHRSDSLHEPSFPHSVPLGLLSQLGVVGLSLFIGFMAAAITAARRQLRGGAGGATAAALMIPAYWLFHGTFDWFWEFPALAGPAIGFLAVAARVDGARAQRRERPVEPRERRRILTGAAIGVAAALAVTAILALASTAIADAYIASAESEWHLDPAASYRMLHLASRLDPLSATALVVSGSIALELREYGRAHETLAGATRREPRNWYAWFQLALADASRSQWAAARAEIVEAQRLNPRDPVVLRAATLVAAGKPFSVAGLEALYLGEFRQRFQTGTTPG